MDTTLTPEIHHIRPTLLRVDRVHQLPLTAFSQTSQSNFSLFYSESHRLLLGGFSGTKHSFLLNLPGSALTRHSSSIRQK